jgi:hypothetical protein
MLSGVYKGYSQAQYNRIFRLINSFHHALQTSCRIVELERYSSLCCVQFNVQMRMSIIMFRLRSCY